MAAEEGEDGGVPNRDEKNLLPFSGLRILSFAQVTQGPATVQLFADLGADVIKVERPGSGAWERNFAPGNAWRGGESFLFQSFNRNRRSIAVDLKTEKGRRLVLRLAEEADVVVENFRPGVMDRLGLGYEDLSAPNPQLVYLSASSYGSTGPYSSYPGQDLLVQALTGLASATGRADDPPIPAGAPIVDLHSATVNAFAVCAALRQRDQTGSGQKIEGSLTEAGLHLQSEGLFLHLNGWSTTQRSATGIGHPYSTAPYGIYETKDGHIALSNSPFEKYAQVLQVPELEEISEEEALLDRDRIRRMIEPVLRTKATAEWLDLFRAQGVWCGPVMDYEEMLDDAHIRSMEPAFAIQHPRLGEIRHMRMPFKMTSAPLNDLPKCSPPELGEHTDEVLTEAGYGESEARELRDLGIVE